jgi:transcriptional regulator with XRE-family HTH domain
MGNNNLYARVKYLCDKNKISIYQLERKLGISNGYIKKWKTSISPSIDKISKVAEYFGVSVDYLIGKSDIEGTAETVLDDEGTLIMLKAKNVLPSQNYDQIKKMICAGIDYYENSTNNEE